MSGVRCFVDVDAVDGGDLSERASETVRDGWWQ